MIVRERFWSKVAVREEEDYCWVWLAGTNNKGYGKLKITGRWVLAHRFAYEDRVGTIPEGLILRHTCDNPPCCNPRHLVPGTHLDNTVDKMSRGRHRFSGFCKPGESHPRSRLTECLVLEIMTRIQHTDESHSKIASDYSVDRSVVYRIGALKAWAHLFI